MSRSGIGAARKTLNRAFAELKDAEASPKDLELRRQVAEKAWRAVREATYAVVECATGKVPKGTINSKAVEQIEAEHLGRSRGSGQPLTQAYSQAIELLHGGCFYEGDCMSIEALRERLTTVNDDIDRAAADLTYCQAKRRT